MTDGKPGPGRPRGKTDPNKPKRQRRNVRRDRELASWAQEIYTAPPGTGQTTDETEAQVTVSTCLRKPKVHLTAPATAPKVDLSRYMGRWYEIARLPYFTERRCVKNVTADYKLGEDGMVYVTNRCIHKDGGTGQAKAIARVVDRASNARLEISFRTLYGVHVLWDDYWIIGVGADYDYALVGQPTRRRGWVLSRDPVPAEDKVQQWIAEFGTRGFPTEDFIRTPQDADQQGEPAAPSRQRPAAGSPAGTRPPVSSDQDLA
ncbi:lipocalin family protein [Thiohalocapsa marina]|uniref:Lipocalin family protein n=1 Tax=Thiohalocapsa marina TaxID=424902 RepID=A0A5M8FKS9_9GAMM|nr:lipocalin family protein [Thiohalocapsa marina]KAA6184346.1 lipocalin family protein [Thiohalocapsa marina]